MVIRIQSVKKDSLQKNSDLLFRAASKAGYITLNAKVLGGPSAKIIKISHRNRVTPEAIMFRRRNRITSTNETISVKSPKEKDNFATTQQFNDSFLKIASHYDDVFEALVHK